MCIMVPMGRVQMICDFQNYDYWTGNAIGFRASRELCLNLLVYVCYSSPCRPSYFTHVAFIQREIFNLRVLSDRREKTMPHNRKWIQFCNVFAKIWGKNVHNFIFRTTTYSLRSRTSLERVKMLTVGKLFAWLRSLPHSAKNGKI